MNIRRLKNITRKHLPSQQKLATKKEKEHLTGTLEVCFNSLGEYQKAKEYHEKALAIATEIGDKNGEGSSYGCLGGVFQSLGEYQKAKEYHEKALAIATEIGEKEKDHLTGGLEECFNHSVNIRRLKNITRKHLPSQQKLATETEKDLSREPWSRVSITR